VRLEVTKRKCQGYGQCTATAPGVFALGEGRKVEVVDPAGAPAAVILEAARGCPYRVITVFDDAGEPLFPPPRKQLPSRRE
jgi:ferredoxin